MLLGTTQTHQSPKVVDTYISTRARHQECCKSYRAQLFLWTNNGGNIQPIITTNGGAISIDLSAYASTLALLGATAFTKVGIGGIDLLGASQGFDLDAVSIVTVPEPATLALLGVGLLGFGLRRRLSPRKIAVRR